MADDPDVIVVGMGAGGEDVAERLADAGLVVLGIEDRLVGGECPYYACIPTKMMIRAADMLADSRRIPGFAGASAVAPGWDLVAQRIRTEATDDWNDRVAVERFEKKDGRFVRGRAKLAGVRTVSVEGTTYRARRAVVIATGSSPAIPPIQGLTSLKFWTNREAVQLRQLPQSLLIIGGGPVGLEFAQAFARFGVSVTIIEAKDRILAGEEPEVSDVLARVLRSDGITIRTNAAVISAEQRDGKTLLKLRGGDQVVGEALLVATGRRPNLKDLGLDTVGLDPAAHFVNIDGRCRAADGLWAIGDVTPNGGYTHIATYHAGIAVQDILGKCVPGADYRAKPRVTFTDPEVGAVGLTEKQARDKGIAVQTGIQPVPHTTRGWIHGPGNDGLIKVVEDRDRGVLVGATSMGPRGGDVLGIFELAIKEKVPTDHLRHLIYAYPTFYRGAREALTSLGAAAPATARQTKPAF